MKLKYLISAGIIAGSIIIGLFFQLYSSAIDSPVEQAAEAVLKGNGIDVDFSENKKKATQGYVESDDDDDDDDDVSDTIVTTTKICDYSE